MKKSKIDRLIESIRKLNEEGITNTSNSASLGFDPQTETPPVKNKKKRIYMKGMRSWWKKMTNNK